MLDFRHALRVSAKKRNVIFRRNAGDGVWVSFLLPTAVFASGWNARDASSTVCSSCKIYSVNLLLNSFVLLHHVRTYNSLDVTRKLNVFIVVPFLITLYLYTNITEFDFTQSLRYAVANALIYFDGLPFVLKVFPNTFTFGEGNLVVQGLSLFLFSSFMRINNILSGSVANDELNASTTILEVGLTGMLILCVVPFVFQPMRNPLSLYIWTGVVMFGFVKHTADYLIRSNSILWLWNFFLKDERLPILLLWASCCVVTGALIWHRINLGQKADTIIRKYFHVLADVVYVTGVVFDPNLLYFSSGCAFALFILFEIVRIMKIPPCDKFLQNSFQLYANEQDSGVLGVTAIYLLVGYSLPLWLHPTATYSSRDHLKLLSGVLSVGVGDTCASVLGKAFGRHKWKGSNKSVEGTLACVLGQSAFVFGLTYLGWCDLPSSSGLEYLKVLAAVVVPSLVEAFTDQIDNIVLPLITYAILAI